MAQSKPGNEARAENGSSSTFTDAPSNSFRCRHLQAISLRNLNFPIRGRNNNVPVKGSLSVSLASSANPPPSIRVPSSDLSQILSDEEALSSGDETDQADSTQAPSRMLQDTEVPQQSELQPISTYKVRGNDTTASSSSKPSRPKRPHPDRQISRSMSSAYAEARQRAYEARLLSRRITSFYSLHSGTDCTQMDKDPVYVSEVQPTSMNPNFRPLQSGEVHNRAFLRSRRLILRVWSKTSDDGQYTLLMEDHVTVPNLHFVSRDPGFIGSDFRDNTVLYHFPDGVYTSYLSESFERRSETARNKAPESKSASFDALMRLKTLMDVRDDASMTQHKVTAQIEAILKNKDRATTLEVVGRETLVTVHEAVARTGRDVNGLRHEKEMRRGRLDSRKKALAAGQDKLSQAQKTIASLQKKCSTTKNQRIELAQRISSHSARIAEDFLTIFPIAPIPEDPLSFTIRECSCPHAKAYERAHPPADDQEVSAALGFVATIVNSLSRSLLLHVPYRIHALGSNSTVRDEITASIELVQNGLLAPGANTHQGNIGGARTFPLYAKGADPARFRYGVYLLNRDIEELVTKIGLRVVDVRDTSANIGFLLNAIAGTTRQLPKREAGRIAALRISEQQFQ